MESEARSLYHPPIMQNPFDSAPGQPSENDDVAVAPAKPALRRPSMWQVVMLNDDFTPMDFVVAVLTHIFDLELPRAVRCMMEVHELGKSVVGVYTKEVAELKVADTLALAEQEGHPLKVVLERVSS